MKTILLIGEIYSYNLGDGVLCKIVERILSDKNNFKILCLDMSLRCGYIKLSKYHYSPLKKELVYIRSKFFPQRNRIILKKRKCEYEEKLKSILENENIDAIIFAGGQMFKDTFIDRISVTIKIAHKKDIPIYFNACGCANFLSNQIKDDLKIILDDKIVKYISLRDGYDDLIKICNRTIKDTYDTALLVNQYHDISVQKTDKVGIGIMISKNQDMFAQICFWKLLLKKMARKGIQFELFTNGVPEDYAFAEYLSATATFNNCCTVAKRPNTPEELIDIIGKYKVIISMRLHSLIIAYSFKIPALAISWDRKIDTFYIKMGLQKYSFKFSERSIKIIDAMNEAINDKKYFEKYNLIQSSIAEEMSTLCDLLKNK